MKEKGGKEISNFHVVGSKEGETFDEDYGEDYHGVQEEIIPEEIKVKFLRQKTYSPKMQQLADK